MQISKDNVVGIRYTLKDLEGKTLDSNVDGAPLYYLQGHSNIIIGLEEQLEGKSQGDNVDVKIEPAKAYGEHDSNLKVNIPKDQFPPEATLEVNMQFEASGGGQRQIFTIKEVADDHVVADGNHPLAGVTLHFQVEVLEVREATSDELAHGHVHGPGGHQH